MSEWWTYRPSDFLMFSPRTYHRLVELYNAEVWPAHVLAMGLGVAMLLNQDFKGRTFVRTAWIDK